MNSHVTKNGTLYQHNIADGRKTSSALDKGYTLTGGDFEQVSISPQKRELFIPNLFNNHADLVYN